MKVYKKNLKKSIICFVLIVFILIASVLTPYQKTKAMAGGIAAGYTIAQILAILGVSLAGTVILTDVVNGNVPDEFFIELNSRQAGIGDKLKQYCEIGKTLSPGDKLTMSNADFIQLRNFLADNPVSQFVGDFATGYNPDELNSIIDKISSFYGHNINNDNGTLASFLSYNSGSSIRMLKTTYWDTLFLISNNATVNITNDNINVTGNAPYAFAFCQGAGGVTSFGYNGAVQNRRNEGYSWGGVINGLTMTATQDPAISLPLVNGDYNILTPGRTMDYTGAIEGNIAITMPLTGQLDRAIAEANAQAIYNLTNVFPVTTATDTLVYYPDISAKGYEVADREIPTTLDFAGLNNIIERNSDNYTMDLSSFFPFCIPFDVYAFVEAFDAEPEAPSVTWLFPTGTGQYVEQTIDLSPFNVVASVVRTLELIAFIVGLAMVTRSFFIRG